MTSAWQLFRYCVELTCRRRRMRVGLCEHSVSSLVDLLRSHKQRPSHWNRGEQRRAVSSRQNESSRTRGCLPHHFASRRFVFGTYLCRQPLERSGWSFVDDPSSAGLDPVEIELRLLHSRAAAGNRLSTNAPHPKLTSGTIGAFNIDEFVIATFNIDLPHTCIDRITSNQTDPLGEKDCNHAGFPKLTATSP